MASFFIYIIVGVLILFNTVALTYLKFRSELPSTDNLQEVVPLTPTVFYSHDGIAFASFSDKSRIPLALSNMSKNVINAFVSAEDRRFFSHTGFDTLSLLRALWANMKNMSIEQGGSTITQQVAKNALLNREKTFSRKFKDLILAYQIERNYTKEQILEIYLNTIYLGYKAFGVEAASEVYFQKQSHHLSPAEAALLAALAPAPSLYSKRSQSAKLKQRQESILFTMYESGFLSPSEYHQAIKEQVFLKPGRKKKNTVALYFVDEVKRALKEKLGLDEIADQGLQVTTTLDLTIQEQAEKNIKSFFMNSAFRSRFSGRIGHIKKLTFANVEDFFKIEFEENKEKKDRDPSYMKAIVVKKFPKTKTIGLLTSKGVGLAISDQQVFNLFAGDKSYFERLKEGDVIRVKEFSDEDALNPYRKQFDLFTSSLKILAPYVKKNKEKKLYALTDFVNVESAVLVTEPNQGHVLAMVGGLSYQKTQFNRATQAKRQVGSCVKPLYFSHALDVFGFRPDSVIHYKPISIGGWTPKQAGRIGSSGSLKLRDALAYSHNIASITLYRMFNPGDLENFFKSLGLQWPVEHPSIALGSGSASLKDLTDAYSIFSNKGVFKKSSYLLEVRDLNNKKLYEKEPISGQRIISSHAAASMRQMLSDVVKKGTGRAIGEHEGIGGKTGTTNDNHDTWFIGYMPHFSMGVWVGYDRFEKSLGSASTGSSIAAPLWRDISEQIMNLNSEKTTEAY